MKWYNTVTQDLSTLPNFISFYENELVQAKKETSVRGNIERSLSDLPGILEERFSQLQDIEAVLHYLNIRLRKVRADSFKKFLEAYPRALTSRDADKYVDGDDDVISDELLVNEVALLRNRWLSIIKSLESKSFSLNNITKLRVAGMEDASI